MSKPIFIRSLLKDYGACWEGIEDAIAFFGPTLPPGVSLAWAVAVAFADETFRLRWRAGWAVGRLVLPEEVGVVAAACLARARLMHSDLSGADLTGADLSGAILSFADLTGADLSGACLAEADLFRADLTGADLTDANLTDAYLDGAFRGPDDPPIPGWVLDGGRLRRAPWQRNTSTKKEEG